MSCTCFKCRKQMAPTLVAKLETLDRVEDELANLQLARMSKAHVVGVIGRLMDKLRQEATG